MDQINPHRQIERRMSSLEVIILCFFLFFICFPDMITSSNDEKCSSQTCYTGEPEIRFPFKLESVQLSNCGYPGFDVACSNQTKTVLQLPSSGMFFVQDINYISQSIRISDPDNCLPRRLLYLNLSSSPFKSVYNHNYTFLNCTYEILFEPMTWINYISCFSSRGDYYVLAASSMTPVRSFHRYCKVIKTVLVPVQFPVGDELSFLGYDFQGITLSWDEPDCRYCEARNQGCKLRNKTSHETRCFGKGLTAGVISGISIGIGLPALLGIIFYVTCCTRVCYDNENQPSNVDFSNVTSLQPVIPLISLNDSTIDSYPKIVLGESRRLPKPDDNICPICLSEYLPKEILKIIPECNHNFHVDCIDQWLHTNMTCPVCRNSPT